MGIFNNSRVGMLKDNQKFDYWIFCCPRFCEYSNQLSFSKSAGEEPDVTNYLGGDSGQSI